MAKWVIFFVSIAIQQFKHHTLTILGFCQVKFCLIILCVCVYIRNYFLPATGHIIVVHDPLRTVSVLEPGGPGGVG